MNYPLTPLLGQNAACRHVAVVDPRPNDYAPLLADLAAVGMSFHFLPSGRDAIRLARTHGADLWVLSTSLTDIAGLDLCSMLKEDRPESVVYVVADEHSVIDERAAWKCGATLLVYKPVREDWFGWLRTS
jgi:DNA-binding response OmpR family regulator